MRLALGAVLSLLGPLAAGWLLVRTLWPESPRLLRATLGAITGAGLAGTIYFFALALTDSRTISLAASETLLIGGSVVLFVMRRPALSISRRGHLNPYVAAACALTALIATSATVSLLDYQRHGGWDAIAIWNTKARFIFRSEADPLDRIVDPALGDTQPDYPLFLPSLVARGWQYAGRDSTLISTGIAGFFTLATLLITISGLTMVTSRMQAWLAGCILMGTPFFLAHGTSQYADIVMCCFMTTTVILFCIHDALQFSWRLPLLAGLIAGFASCTKNEGMLFVIVVAGTRVLINLGKRTFRHGGIEFAGFAAGALIGVTALMIFKTLHSPPNQIVGGVTAHLFQERFRSSALHLTILRNYVKRFMNFGEWWIYPVPLLLIHMVVARWGSARPAAPWLTPALVFPGLMAGYYMVYLLTPYDLQWHLDTSLPRLLLQIWPTLVILYSILAAPPESQAAGWKATNSVIE